MSNSIIKKLNTAISRGDEEVVEKILSSCNDVKVLRSCYPCAILHSEKDNGETIMEMVANKIRELTNM